MNRRQLLNGLTASAVTLPFTLTNIQKAKAEMSCTQPQYYNGGLVRKCTVGFRIGRFTARQRCQQWCWAACIEAAFDLYGYRVPQEAIVEKIFGPDLPCRTSVGPQIAQAVEGYWEDVNGGEFYATTKTHMDTHFGVNDPYALSNATRYLADDIPVIVGALGHATLLTAISWLEDNYGQQRLTEIIVRDPWPGNRNRRAFRPDEFYGTTYMAAVVVD